MGQQVGDDELGVVRLVANAHLDRFHLAVVAHADHAAQFKRDRGPLVLFDAAVVVGLEEAQLIALVQGVLLQVQPGGVDVGRPDVDPCSRPFRPITASMMALSRFTW